MRRLLDAQDRCFDPARRAAGARHFQQITGRPLEVGVTLHDPDGRAFHVRKVVQHYVVSEKTVKEVLVELTYYHDEMSDSTKSGIFKASQENKVPIWESNRCTSII